MIETWKRLDVYHLIIIFLAVAGISAVYVTGNIAFLVQLILAPVVASIVDIAISYAKTRQRIKPITAIISGLIIALILPLSPFHIVAFAAAVAMVLKHVIKWKGRNVFNPAASGLIVTSVLFAVDTVWWVSASLLTVLGFLVVYKLGRLRTSIAFLVVYFALVYLTTQQVQLLDLTAIFFATIMLIEPKTSPHTKNGKIVFGVAVAVLAIAIQFTPLGKDPFLISLLVMNLFTGAINKRIK